MQLRIKAKGEGAENLSYLLAKNPNNLYDRDEKFFRVRFVFPTFGEKESEALIFVTPDSVELVRNSPNTYDITQYINDREFVVSSLFCTSIRKALGTALNGKPKEEYLEWVDHKFDLEIGFGPIASQISDEGLRELFLPLGYSLEIERGQTDYSFDLKQRSSVRFLTLKGNVTVQNALRHLFILIPVIDNYKHYFIDDREIDKLERYGEGWLEKHPLRDYIIKQSLRFSDVIQKAEQSLPIKSDHEKNKVSQKNQTIPKVRLNQLRYEAIVEKISSLPLKQRIVDLGSGEGKLSVRLGTIKGVKEILAVEPSESAQLKAMERFEKAGKHGDYLLPTPIMGSLFYYDERLLNADVIILCEVIEHIDEHRLQGIMKMILGEYEPKALIVTTPNQEYNAVYDLNENMRHLDHRFEWTRSEFKSKCEEWIQNFPYTTKFEGIGQEHEEFGHPTQMCTFVKKEGNE
ncbi:3' terminal RNA ribose 2'-O-methyltransferase Hen1 [Bacillus sp. B15-48]|uniref:3' terminal RNA ribose 2'-O-methyltransferase Hen1 n=1 Tax=Bacillus sp. B15-48 TaxID=1548601 RepID=UPI00193F6C46|nr:3' terminal RNA ribose 2'-O-methyltransferase Hen1 [Bacillus sp. B15-48]MBM4761305.1 3' terminal RNA ribose 2'-O-methyltransferase Hen1 [Bacillus sp. B15-48]